MNILGRWVVIVGVLLVACSGDADPDAAQACETDADCGGNASCDSRQCVEHADCDNTLDCPGGQVCFGAAGYCVQCLQDADCAGNAGCLDQRCRPRCASDKDCVDHGLLCGFEYGLCVDCIVDDDCAESAFCQGGDCQADTCVPGPGSCGESPEVIIACMSNGAAEEERPCPFGRVCSEEAGQAQCVLQECEPDSLYCDETGRYLQQCSADGMSSQMLMDCQDDDRVCVELADVDATCEEQTCSAGQRYCSGGAVRQCNPSGTRSSIVETCSPGTYCESDSATCVAGGCTPLEKVCTADGLATCNGEGSGYADVTPCGSDEVCIARPLARDTCDTKVCEPNSAFCDGGQPHSCDETGTVATQTSTCTAVQYCDSIAITCQPQLCVPNAKTCLSNTARTCNAEGSNYSEQTPCGGDICDGGECKPEICTPNQEFCQDYDVMLCNSLGTGATLDEDCDDPGFWCYEDPDGGMWCNDDEAVGGQGGT